MSESLCPSCKKNPASAPIEHRTIWFGDYVDTNCRFCRCAHKWNIIQSSVYRDNKSSYDAESDSMSVTEGLLCCLLVCLKCNGFKKVTLEEI